MDSLRLAADSTPLLDTVTTASSSGWSASSSAMATSHGFCGFGMAPPGLGTILAIFAGLFGFIALVWIFAGWVGWKIFAKAGKPGLAALIPGHNTVVALEIAGRPLWWALLTFVPFVNLVVFVVVSFDLAKRFGKGTGFGFGLLFLGFLFYPILAFGSATYHPDDTSSARP